MGKWTLVWYRFKQAHFDVSFYVLFVLCIKISQMLSLHSFKKPIQRSVKDSWTTNFMFTVSKDKYQCWSVSIAYFEKGLWPLLLTPEFWYHLYNLRNMINNHGGILLLVKLLLKWHFSMRVYHVFELFKWQQIAQSITCVLLPPLLLTKVIFIEAI